MVFWFTTPCSLVGVNATSVKWFVPVFKKKVLVRISELEKAGVTGSVDDAA